MGKFDDLGDAVRQAARLADDAPAPQVIRAYHGSPYDFDRFDASKIGTGEGAQAYGHGLYFAGDENVANQYRRKLTEQPGAGIVLYYDNAGNRLPTDLTYRLEDDRAVHGWGPAAAPEAAKRIAAEYILQADAMRNRGLGGYEVDWPEQSARQLREYAARGLRPAGRTYEVEIAAPESAFLDFDVPVAAQSESVKEALSRLDPRQFGVVPHDVGPKYGGLRWKTPWDTLIGHPVQGKSIDDLTFLDSTKDVNWSRAVYQDVAAMAKSEALAAKALRESGIPGIRYLDQRSRAAGEGTRNYVMFPGTEDSIRILRKFAVPGAVGVGAASMSGEE